MRAADEQEAEGVTIADVDALAQRVEDLEHALRWSLGYIEQCSVVPGGGEEYEDHSGATRIAWPDNPENWS